MMMKKTIMNTNTNNMIKNYNLVEAAYENDYKITKMTKNKIRMMTNILNRNIIKIIEIKQSMNNMKRAI